MPWQSHFSRSVALLPSSLVYPIRHSCQQQPCLHNCPWWMEYFTERSPVLAPQPVYHGLGTKPERQYRVLNKPGLWWRKVEARQWKWRLWEEAGESRGILSATTEETRIVPVWGGGGGAIGWLWSGGQRYVFTVGKLARSLNTWTKTGPWVSEQQRGYCFSIFFNSKGNIWQEWGPLSRIGPFYFTGVSVFTAVLMNC